jgi:hypothetical protein
MSDQAKAMAPEEVTRLVVARLTPATRPVSRRCTSPRRCWPTPPIGPPLGERRSRRSTSRWSMPGCGLASRRRCPPSGSKIWR